jgi:hypothetical protein
MRLRALSEAECYARCYGGHGDERVSVVRLLPRRSRRANATGERVRASFAARLEVPGPEAEAA